MASGRPLPVSGKQQWGALKGVAALCGHELLYQHRRQRCWPSTNAPRDTRQLHETVLIQRQVVFPLSNQSYVQPPDLNGLRPDPVFGCVAANGCE